MNPLPLNPETVKLRSYLTGPKATPRKSKAVLKSTNQVPTLADLIPLYERHAKLERILAATVSSAILKFRTQKLRMPRREAQERWGVSQFTLAAWESGASVPPKHAVERMVQWAREHGFADEDT